VAAIPRGIERQFSKRRQATEAATEARGYSIAKGMELAALRTRKAKRAAPREVLFEMWHGLRAPLTQAKQQHAAALDAGLRKTSAPSPISEANMRLARAATGAARSIDQSAAMPGVAVDLRQREKDHSRE